MHQFSLASSNPSLSSTKMVCKIAKPFLEATGLNFFSYARDFDRNKSISLQTDNDLFHAWFESQSPYCSQVTPDGVYTSDMIQNNTLQENSRHMNYGSGIHIFKRYESFSEIISIAAPQDKMNVLQFYINNIDIINKFIIYFKDKAAKLIQEATNQPILVPEGMMCDMPAFTVAQPDMEQLHQNLKIKRFYFEDSKGIKLSRREMECLAHYIKGLSTSQIASLMGVKKVTADTFMRNIKCKLNCSSRSELFRILIDLGVIKVFDIFN